MASLRGAVVDALKVRLDSAGARVCCTSEAVIGVELVVDCGPPRAQTDLEELGVIGPDDVAGGGDDIAFVGKSDSERLEDHLQVERLGAAIADRGVL